MARLKKSNCGNCVFPYEGICNYAYGQKGGTSEVSDKGYCLNHKFDKEMTCFGCNMKCEFFNDFYNTNGDCLMTK